MILFLILFEFLFQNPSPTHHLIFSTFKIGLNLNELVIFILNFFHATISSSRLVLDGLDSVLLLDLIFSLTFLISCQNLDESLTSLLDTLIVDTLMRLSDDRVNLDSAHQITSLS
jgi:hypothetical protein